MTDSSDIPESSVVADRPEVEVVVDQPVMSRDLTEFLIQLSIAVHRFSMYPPGHPSLEPAAEGVV